MFSVLSDAAKLSRRAAAERGSLATIEVNPLILGIVLG